MVVLSHLDTQAAQVVFTCSFTFPRPLGGLRMTGRAALDAVLAELRDSLTVPEVAELIGVHQATVYRAVKSGRLRSTSRGSGQVRQTLTKIPPSAVLEFLGVPAAVEELAS
jgi:excisionase family DNA binding protein